MPTSCSAYGCANRHNTGGNLQFFGFPFKNPELLQKWLVAVKRKGFTPTKSSKLCSAHFSEENYLVRPGGYVRHLKADAVPSVFPAFPSYYQPIIKKQRKTHERSCEEQLPTCSKLPTSLRLPEEPEENLFLNNRDVGVQTDPFYHARNVKLLRRRVKTLQQKVRRQTTKIQNLRDLLLTLDQKGFLDASAQSYLMAQFEGTALDIFKNQVSNGKRAPHGVRYSEEIKKFALTLHYYSAKAYNFCRTILRLPHPSSITNWTSTVDAEPGFFNEVFAALKTFPFDERNCTLLLDGMSIKKQILWDAKNDRFVGYCDYGSNLQLEGAETPATEALVFMLVSLTGKWKLPIGYFFQQKATANVQSQLIQTAITLANNAGLRVWAVTCDGTTTNFSSLTLLGCNVYGNFNSLVPYFINNNDQKDKVYFVPDACHMLKLARNALGSSHKLYTAEGCIDWGYIERLHEIQQGIGLKFENKLSKAHLEWETNKMKVKLAGQTLSSSIADSLEFLKKQGLQEFQNCGETIKFIRAVDRIFDFLNSRNPFAKGYKKPIYVNNLEFLQKSILPLIEYLFTLKDSKNVPLFQSPRKTFIIGFAIAVKSVFGIANTLLPAENNFKYILTYKFSQDHLELLFSRIRKRLGYNNNPNVLQFKTSMKTIILKNAITASPSANCIALDNDPAGNIFDINWAKRKKSLGSDDPFGNIFNTENIMHDDEYEAMLCVDLFSKSSTTVVAECKENILYYIGGFIVRSIFKKINCSSCRESLFINSTEHNYPLKFSFSKLVNVKNKGGLILASADVQKILITTEKEIAIHTVKTTKLNFNCLSRNIIFRAIIELAEDRNLFKQLNCDNEVYGERVHKLELLKLICQSYIKIRFCALSKNVSAALHPVNKRHKLNKLILFSNQ